MLLIENKKGMKVYTIKNKYLCECGVLNEENVCNACVKYMNKGYIYSCTIYPYGNCITFRFIENDHRTFNSYSKKFMYEQLLRYYKKGLNSWIELYNNDCFKTKKEKKRINYYINKLNEFERLLND